MDLLVQFRDNWQRRKFASKDQRVLLAVSGGIDSMVMADLFLKAGISFGIAHCNFQLRGADALLDEHFVKAWADHNNIPFHVTRFDTLNISRDWKKGIQETARILRYEWLDEVRGGNGYGLIATAHHANDNAETLLMNLFKGTGISGLHGIPERNEKIIRPVLFAARAEIEAYAAAHDISYREDISNTSDKYLRNAVRLNILPVVETYFPNVVHQLNESIGRFSQAELLYRGEVDRKLRKLKDKRGNDIYVPVLKLMKMQPLETLCYELFRTYGFSSQQVPQLLRLAASDSGHFIESATHRVIRDRDFLIITARAPEETGFITIDAAPCNIDTGSGQFHFSLIKRPDIIPTSPQIACIDARRISFPLILRKWRTGDYFYPLGMGMKKKKLSRFFIDQKIPLHEKEQIWVLECRKRIVWVAGMRLDERFRVTDATDKILKVELRMK